MFSDRFFTIPGAPIPVDFSDDPPKRDQREFHPFNTSELEDLLKETSNTSAPGSSGIGWLILKKAWDLIKDHLCAIYNACLLLGHHPRVCVTVTKPSA